MELLKKRYRPGRSLRVRIGSLIFLSGLLLMAAARFGFAAIYESSSLDSVITSGKSQLAVLAKEMAQENYLENTNQSAINEKLRSMMHVRNARLLVVGDDYRILYDSYQLENGKTAVSRGIMEAMSGKDYIRYDKNEQIVYLAIGIYGAQEETKEGDAIRKLPAATARAKGVLTMSYPSTYRNLGLEEARLSSNILLIGAVAVCLGLSIFLSGRLMRPLWRMKQNIQNIEAGYETELRPETAYSETQQMTEAMGQVLGRLYRTDQSRQDFVSNVSHELKTPLTAMKVLSDSLLMQPDIPVEMYREFLTDITQEIDRETKIINDLLALVSLEKKVNELQIAPVSINELLERATRMVAPLAEVQDIELVVESYREIVAEVDELKISSVLTNLIENAVKYNVEHGWVHINLNADHKYFYIKVVDGGIGIPEDALDQIFERFYRVDKSRSKEIGGTGLGLAIARSIVLLHKGSIKVYSKPGEGTTFTVRIPLTYIQ
ncbi:MAG: HAMP domain-containing sensor histidine kinase [Lachnospiraceae bacterium]|nr:HAMP domain-containing sensor histidine kinase [Lachnospiraceae bacterium]